MKHLPLLTSSPPANSDQESNNETVAHIRGGTAFAPTSDFLPRVTKEVNSSQSWSPSVETVLEQPPASLPLRLMVGGMACCLMLGIWAYFGQIEEIGQAQGKLIPKGETFKIQPLELGKVHRLAVREGETVRAGQILVELDTSLVEKEVEKLQQAISAGRAELEQKQGLVARYQLESETQAAIAKAEQQSQQAAIDLSQTKLSTIRQLLHQQQQEAAHYRNRQQRLHNLSQETNIRMAQLRAEKKAHQERLERLQPLLKEGAISHEMVFQAEQAIRETDQKITTSQLQEINNANEQIFQGSQSLIDLEARITQNQGELRETYQEIRQLQAQFSQKQAQAQANQLEISEKIARLNLEIGQLKAKIKENQTLLATVRLQLLNKYLKAPVDGIVLSLYPKNPGEVVEAGQTLAEIAPEGVPLVLSAVLPNQEAGFVQEGMVAQVKFDAYPYQDYGVVTGRITEISANTRSQEEQGEIYQVEITLEQDNIGSQERPIHFKPGQTASADIVIRRRRIIDVLLEPIKKLQQDGLKL